MQRQSAHRLPFFSERSGFIEDFPSLFNDGGGGPLAPGYSKFLKNWNWMHIVNTVACGDFLKMEQVLDSNAGDIFTFISYLTDKSVAEKQQRDFESKLKIS